MKHTNITGGRDGPCLLFDSARLRLGRVSLVFSTIYDENTNEKGADILETCQS